MAFLVVEPAIFIRIKLVEQLAIFAARAGRLAQRWRLVQQIQHPAGAANE
jgi:hypothetical protein